MKNLKNLLPLIILLVSTLLASCVVPDQNFEPGSDLYKLANPEVDLEQFKGNNAKHEVLVAVLDGGIDYNAKGLQKSLRYINYGGLEGVGLDLLGQDMLPSYQVIDTNPGDFYLKDISHEQGSYDHGTHVSRLAVLGGVYHIDGEKKFVSDHLGLIPVRLFPLVQFEGYEEMDLIPRFKKEIENVVLAVEKGMDFSQEMNASVVNMSIGVSFQELPDEKAVEELEEFTKIHFHKKANTDWKDMLMVIAAGNEGQELSKWSYSFPGGIDLPNILTVGALDNSNQISDYSNYGKVVKIYIRGTDIKSQVPEGKMDKLSGTSMAAPLVANLASKIKLTNIKLTALQIKKMIIDCGDIKKLPISKTEKFRVVNVANFGKTLKFARKSRTEVDFKISKEACNM
jgi:subtilisin family serine protease